MWSIRWRAAAPRISRNRRARSQTANLARTEQRFVAPERFNLWPQAKLHTQWPGSGKPGDPASTRSTPRSFPRSSAIQKQQELNRDAGIALLDKIGPAVLLMHSQSGAFAWPIADARPKLVKAIIAVEPNGPPVYETEFKGAPDGSPTSGKKQDLRPRRGAAHLRSAARRPAKSLPSCARTSPTRPTWCAAGSRPSRRASCQNLARIPILIVVAEASYHAAYDHCTANYLTQAGVPNTFIRLGDVGIRGNGHMMMLEKNSDDIAGVIEDWLMKTLAKKQAASRQALIRLILRSGRRPPSRSMGRSYAARFRLVAGFAARFFGAAFFFAAAFFFPLPHNSLLASRAPSTSACSFAHWMVGWTRW